MFGLLSQVLCWLRQVGALVADALMAALNAIIAALASAIVTLSGLLPAMPSFPSVPSPVSSTLGWIAWFFPVHQLVLLVAFFLTAWLTWFAVALALRWAKGLS